jgi:hypothetical protein
MACTMFQVWPFQLRKATAIPTARAASAGAGISAANKCLDRLQQPGHNRSFASRTDSRVRVKCHRSKDASSLFLGMLGLCIAPFGQFDRAIIGAGVDC